MKTSFRAKEWTCDNSDISQGFNPLHMLMKDNTSSVWLLILHFIMMCFWRILHRTWYISIV